MFSRRRLIDQREPPLDSSYTYPHSGAGVNVYIIDTGIRLTHGDFGGRAQTGFDAVTPGGDASDCNGHGTHVAGAVAGSGYRRGELSPSVHPDANSLRRSQ